MNLPSTSLEFETLKRVLCRLEQACIPYMLTGSMALNFYGHPRATNDFDIVVEVRSHHKKQLLDLFSADFYIDGQAIDDALAHESLFNVIDNESIFKIDFIIKKNDALAEQQFSRRQTKELADVKAYVISPEDLIIAKLQWSAESLSEMQERDIKNMLRLLAKELDYAYLEKWAASLGQLERLRSMYV